MSWGMQRPPEAGNGLQVTASQQEKGALTTARRIKSFSTEGVRNRSRELPERRAACLHLDLSLGGPKPHSCPPELNMISTCMVLEPLSL